MDDRIFLSTPHLGQVERGLVEDAFNSNWITPLGYYVDTFERLICEYTGVKSAVALNSGTAAVHLALRTIGLKQNDKVFCSSLTFAASCNPIIYENATPVFIDSEEKSYNMSPYALEKAFSKYIPKAVVVVNLYGQSADYDAIIALCDRYNVPVIEDAAESIGATYKGKKSGTLGKYGVYSFNGNKIVTTSGGGMVVSNDEEAIEKMRFWASQSKEPTPYYQHNELGFNYRLSNICAAIGVGQMEVLDERLVQKKRIYDLYREAFSNLEEIEMYPICDFGVPNYWLSIIKIKDGCSIEPEQVIGDLENENIEARYVWKPMNLQPFYKECAFFSHIDNGSVGENLFNKGVCLPSDTKMTDSDILRVIEAVKRIFK